MNMQRSGKKAKRCWKAGERKSSFFKIYPLFCYKIIFAVVEPFILGNVSLKAESLNYINKRL